MLLKSSPYHLFIFPGNVFCDHTTVIGEYFLGVNFKLYLPCNALRQKNHLHSLKSFYKFLKASYSIYWARVTFRGKGYRLRKFKQLNKLTCNFGHSHWTKFSLNTDNFFFKKLRRQNYLCIVKPYHCLKRFKIAVRAVRPLNVYTKRGLRLRREFIKRRFGKISQVVSSLH